MSAKDTAASKRATGFALMTPERRRELASRGGKKAQADGSAHQWTSSEARDAGRKGGPLSGRARRLARDRKAT